MVKSSDNYEPYCFKRIEILAFNLDSQRICKQFTTSHCDPHSAQTRVNTRKALTHVHVVNKYGIHEFSTVQLLTWFCYFRLTYFVWDSSNSQNYIINYLFQTESARDKILEQLDSHFNSIYNFFQLFGKICSHLNDFFHFVTLNKTVYIIL